MRVTILQLEAKESLIQIKEYIIQDSVFYANKTIEEILKRIHNLEIFPYLVKQVEIRNKKMRQIIYKSYKIFYKLKFNRIYILQIFHHSRDISNLRF